MELDEIINKSTMSVGTVGGGRDGKVSAIGASANNHGPIADKDGMDTLLMVVSMLEMTCSSVVGPCGS